MAEVSNVFSSIKNLFKDSLVYGIADILFKGISFFTFPIYTYFFSVEQYGVVALVSTLATFITVFFVGIHNAVHRYYMDKATLVEKRPELVSTALYFLVLTMIFSLSILMLGLVLTKNYTQYEFFLDWSFLYIAILMVFPYQLNVYCGDVLRLHFTPWKFTFIKGLEYLLTTVFTLMLIVYFQAGVKGFLYGMLYAHLGILPISLWMIRKDLTFSFDIGFVSKIFTFGYPFIFSGIGFWLFGMMDRWMLGGLSNLFEVGLYTVAFKITSLLNIVQAAFSQAWSPHAMKLQSEQNDSARIFSRILTLWSFANLIIGAAMILFSVEFFMCATPKEYWGAAHVLVFLIAGSIFSAASQVITIGITIAKKSKVFVYVTWTCALINCGLNYLLIPKWGAMGAAFTTMISQACLTLLYTYYSQINYPIPLERKNLMTILFLFLVTIPTCLWFVQFHICDWKLILMKISFITILTGLGFVFRLVSLSGFHIYSQQNKSLEKV